MGKPKIRKDKENAYLIQSLILHPYKKVTGSLSVCVPNDLANSWTDMVHRSYEGLYLTILGEVTTFLTIEITPRKMSPAEQHKFFFPKLKS